VGGIHNVDVTNNKLIFQLQQLVRNTLCVLESEQKGIQRRTKTRKALQYDLANERRQQMDADALEKEAEDLAAKVEEKHDFSCIAKSNTLYNTALLLLVSIIGSRFTGVL